MPHTQKNVDQCGQCQDAETYAGPQKMSLETLFTLYRVRLANSQRRAGEKLPILISSYGRAMCEIFLFHVSITVADLNFD